MPSIEHGAVRFWVHLGVRLPIQILVVRPGWPSLGLARTLSSSLAQPTASSPSHLAPRCRLFLPYHFARPRFLDSFPASYPKPSTVCRKGAPCWWPRLSGCQCPSALQLLRDGAAACWCNRNDISCITSFTSSLPLQGHHRRRRAHKRKPGPAALDDRISFVQSDACRAAPPNILFLLFLLSSTSKLPSEPHIAPPTDPAPPPLTCLFPSLVFFRGLPSSLSTRWTGAAQTRHRPLTRCRVAIRGP